MYECYNRDIEMNRKILKIIAGLIILLLVSVSIYYIINPKHRLINTNSNSTDTSITDDNAPSKVLGENDAIAFARNSTFLIDGKEVILINGKSEVKVATDSATLIKTNYFGNEAFGDLNEDGKDDLAFLISQDGGGSGLFYYVIVALNNSDKESEGGAKYIMTNANFIGDRISPQSNSINNGRLFVNFADRRSGEAMTVQPSVGVSKIFSIEKSGRLEEIFRE